MNQRAQTSRDAAAPKVRGEFICMECDKDFWTTEAAERAASEGCPNCGGVDIDLS